MGRNGTMNEKRTPPAPISPEEAARQAYEKELAEAKPVVTLNGVEYRLKYDLWALEQIEAEYGGIRQAFNAMMNGGEGGGIVRTTRKLFAILANCQRNLDRLVLGHSGCGGIEGCYNMCDGTATRARQRTAGKPATKRKIRWTRNTNEKTDEPAADAGPGVLRVRADRRDNDNGSKADESGLDYGHVPDPDGL